MPLYLAINTEQALDSMEYTSYVDLLRRIGKLPYHLIDEHMPHKEHEAYPWHERSFHIGSNNIGANRADQQSADPSPKIEETDQVEKRHP